MRRRNCYPGRRSASRRSLRACRGGRAREGGGGPLAAAVAAPGVGPVERYVVRGRAVAGGSTGDATMEFAAGVCFLCPVSFVFVFRWWLSPLVWRAVCPRTPAQHASTQAARAPAPAVGRRGATSRERGRRPRRGAAPAPQPAAAAPPVDARPRPRARDDVPLRRVCVCAVDGELRESPPSLRSRPLEVPAVPACVEIKFQAPRAVGAMLSLSLHPHDGEIFHATERSCPRKRVRRWRGSLAHWAFHTGR